MATLPGDSAAEPERPSLAIAGIGPPPPMLLGAEREQPKVLKQVRFDETMPELFELDVDLTRESSRAEGADFGGGVRAESSQERLVRVARGLSWISLVASILVASCAFTLGFADGALSLLGYGGEMALDAVSSAFVLWRFKRPKKATSSDASCANSDVEAAKMVLRAAKRERKSSIGIGVTFVLLAGFLIYSAIWKLAHWDAFDPEHVREEKNEAIMGSLLVWISSFFFGGLGVMKLRLAQKLHSQVLQKDGMCSLLGSLLGVIVGITDIIALANQDDPENLALVDPAAGIVIALILLFEGCRTLWHNREGGEHEDAHERLP